MMKHLSKIIAFVLLYVCMCSAATAGTLSRTVVFARFLDDPEFDTPRSDYEQMFNGAEGSLKSYFNTISCGNLEVESYLFPANTGTNTSIELDYCYYCYDSSWRGTYPNCKSSTITGKNDINIAFIIKELAGKIEHSGALPSDDDLDSDGDGFVDNFVVVLRGAGRGTGKGIYTPHVGTVSSTYTNAHGDIRLGGRAIRNYTITYERNSLDTHARFQLNSLGFPNLYPAMGTSPRFTGMWDPMDGPWLSMPLTYIRMKYSGGEWIKDIPVVSEPGEYTLDASVTGNAFRMPSADPSQFWIVEYRDKLNEWESNIPESGLLIYRVNTALSGVSGKNSEIYVCRKDGTLTEHGNVSEAAFSDANGRVSFGPSCNPCPFLADGSKSDTPDISDIIIAGGKAKFRVNSVAAGIDAAVAGDVWRVCVNPSAPDVLQVCGNNIESVAVYDMAGACAISRAAADCSAIDISSLARGVYLVRLSGNGNTLVRKIVVR